MHLGRVSVRLNQLGGPTWEIPVTIYVKHNQANAIDFVDYVIGKFPFRIQMIRIEVIPVEA